MTQVNITGVILAGGRSSRMGGFDKGLTLFNNKALILYAYELLSKVCQKIIISANRNNKIYAQITDATVIEDEFGDFRGPLAGMYQALKIAKTKYLLIIPCDCPLLSIEILNKLIKSLQDNPNSQIIVAKDSKRLQPTFVLLRKDLADDLYSYIVSKNHKID